MIKRILFLLLTAMLMVSCNHSYYIVRHAEKEQSSRSGTDINKDPALTEAGKVRALVLRDELLNKHIHYIYSTNTLRTKSTVLPFSEASGVGIQLYSNEDSLVTELKKIKRENVLIVGHSNTIDDIINKLCGETKIKNDLSESQYDNLFIIQYKGKKVNYTSLKYGYSSNPQ